MKNEKRESKNSFVFSSYFSPRSFLSALEAIDPRK